jgi:hypothetical protein
MLKNQLSILILSLTLIVSYAVIANPVSAEQSGTTLPPTVRILSNDVYYTSSTIDMVFTLHIPTGSKYTWISWIVYFLDNKEQGEIWPKQTSYLDTPIAVTLKNVSPGYHSFKVYAYYPSSITPIYGQATTNFKVSYSVETTPSPSPSIEPSPSAAPSPSPTPSPTLEPTIAPTPTPKPHSGFLGTNLPVEYGYVIIAVAVIAVVALTAVALRKRHPRHK